VRLKLGKINARRMKRPTHRVHFTCTDGQIFPPASAFRAPVPVPVCIFWIKGPEEMGDIKEFNRFRIWAGLAVAAIYIFLLATGNA
jgi:hypothetical protein